MDEITATEIRQTLNLPYSTINHYTNLGLFSVVRKSGNKRIYNFNEVKARYSMIMKLTQEGYPLSLIQRKVGDYINELL